MSDAGKTKKELIKELEALRTRLAGKPDAGHTADLSTTQFAADAQSLRPAFENAIDAIIWADPETGTIVNCNRATEDLLEKTRDEIVGQHHATLHPPDKRGEYTALFKAHVDSERPACAEAEVLTKTGTVKPIHLTASVIVIDGRPIIQGFFRDVTSRKLTEQKLVYRHGLQRIVADIATHFVNLGPGQVPAGIADALQQFGEFIKADRCYVFEFSPDGTTMDNTHEWAADGVEPKIEELQKLDTGIFAWSMAKIKAGETIIVPNVDKLPPEANAEKSEFQSEDIQSLVIAPLVCGGTVLGFLGFDSVWELRTWTDDETLPMQIIGGIIASALARKRTEEELHFRMEFEELVTSISTSFVSLAPQRVNEMISGGLRELAELAGVDHACVFIYSPQTSRVTSTHSWSADNSCHDHDHCFITKISQTQWFIDHMTQLDPIQISSAASIPDEVRQEVTEAIGTDFNWFLCVPFSRPQKRTGCVCMSSKNPERPWGERMVTLVRVVGEIFTRASTLTQTVTALQQERSLIDALLDNSPDCIYFKDSDNHFVRINNAMAARFGLSDPGDAVGKTDLDFFAPDYASHVQADDRAVMKSGTPITAKEEKETWHDGSQTWVSITKGPLFDTKGRVAGTFGIIRDITARKQADTEMRKIEAGMQHTQKLESLGVLSGGIAHDFNNLLMGILGNTGLALSELSQESRAWNSVKQIETVALRAAELTDQMLTYSGRSESLMQPLDLTLLVKEMANLLEVAIPSDVELIRNFSSDAPTIEGDPAQIRQVVMNLITNAADATEEAGGVISVVTGSMQCDNDYFAGCYLKQDLPEGTYSYVEVSDTGYGMDKETQTKIFDPFFTTKVSGRGLGLAAVLGIVCAHDGALRVYSEVDKGTTFRIMFPASDKAIDQQEDAQGRQAGWHGTGTILVADDEEIVRSVTAQMLSALGFTVLLADDAQSTLRQFTEHLDDIVTVLLDVTMPEARGERTLVQLQHMKPGTPVILMSGYNEQTATSNLQPDEFQGFLQKPFKSDALADGLREVL